MPFGTRVRIEAETFTAKYSRAHGTVAIVSTHCRDEAAARAFLGARVRQEELVKGGVLRRQEADMGDHVRAPIGDHVEAFLAYLAEKVGRRGFRLSEGHRENVAHNVRRFIADRGIRSLGDVTVAAVGGWLAGPEAEGMAGATRNTCRAPILHFASWRAKTGRLATNPLVGLSRADESVDRRR